MDQMTDCFTEIPAVLLIREGYGAHSVNGVLMSCQICQRLIADHRLTFARRTAADNMRRQSRQL
jgi:hypothetical protein